MAAHIPAAAGEGGKGSVKEEKKLRLVYDTGMSRRELEEAFARHPREKVRGCIVCCRTSRPAGGVPVTDELQLHIFRYQPVFEVECGEGKLTLTLQERSAPGRFTKAYLILGGLVSLPLLLLGALRGDLSCLGGGAVILLLEAGIWQLGRGGERDALKLADEFVRGMILKKEPE